MSAALSRLATKLPLPTFTISVLLSTAFTWWGAMWGALTRLFVLGLEGLAHTFFEVIVIGHVLSVSSHQRPQPRLSRLNRLGLENRAQSGTIKK